MKKKIINKNILSFIFLFVFTVMISIIRFVQLRFFTDFDVACNNFKNFDLFNLKIDLKLLSYFMYSIIILYFLFLFISFFIKKDPDKQFISISDVNNKDYKKNLITIFLLLFFICSIVLSILHLTVLDKSEIFDNRVIFFMLLFQFLLPLYFLYFLYCLKYKKFDKRKILNVIFIIPVLWGSMRIFAVMYIKDFLLLTSREFVINNFKVSTFTIFLFYFSKFLIGSSSKNNERNLMFFGYLSIFFGLISVIPRIIFYFYNSINKNLILTKSYEFNINILKYNNLILMDFVFVLFILIFLLKYIFCWRKTVNNI